MINEKAILLARLKDYSKHRLAKYIAGNLELSGNNDLYFHKPLQEIFSEVITYDFVKRMTEIGVKGVNEEIIGLVGKERPKYVVWLASIYELLESALNSIREEGSIVVGWLPDDEYRFDYYSKWWIPHLDYCVTHDIEAVPKYQALGAQAIFAFPCEGIPVERDWSKIEERYEVSFVGWKSKGLRAQYIDEIRKRNIPIQLYGTGWGKGYIPHEEMIDIFKTSKINLNFSGTGNRTGLKGRLTTVCLAGGFLLTEYTPGIENFFEIDKEIVCFKNAEEMIDKITFYLNHDEERRTIAQAGWKRAINEYTPFHMFSRVFGKIEKDIATGGGKSRPQKLKMPIWLRNSLSRYYFRWGRAFLEEGYEGLWKDALALSSSYNSFNIAARYYYIIGLSPAFFRPLLFKLYLPYGAVEKLCIKILNQLLGWADSIPYLRNIKQRQYRRSMEKRLHSVEAITSALKKSLERILRKDEK